MGSDSKQDAATTTFSPNVSLPMTEGPVPADASPSAGFSILCGGTEKAQDASMENRSEAQSPSRRLQRTRRVDPVFLTQAEAGRYLGHCGPWLKRKAREHGLFEPSIGRRVQGSPCKYHPEHLDIIIEHMMSPDLFPADEALLAWRRKRADAILALRTPAQTRGRRSGK